MIRRLVGALAIALFCCEPAVATDWVVGPASQEAEEAFRTASRVERVAAPDGLPDGHIATSPGGDIAKAWYVAPTRRYRHGVIGDAIEAGALIVETHEGLQFRLDLPNNLVFEDRTPRLADLDNDGRTEVVTIQSAQRAGAGVAVYGLKGETIVELAHTGFIGIPNRWLNIAGIERYSGDDGLELAYVQTPHIGGTLFFWAYRDGKFTNTGSIYGFSNHAIGSRELRLSASADFLDVGRIDLALPSADRRALRFVRQTAVGPEIIADVALPDRIAGPIFVHHDAGRPTLLLGMSDGSVLSVARRPPG